MIAHYALLFATAAIAGAINSVAGGGTLLTFPMLLSLGVTPIAANATSTVALVPGSFGAFWGYRSRLTGSRATLLAMCVPSLIGGAVGALLVTRVGDDVFRKLVPWLIYAATVMFILATPVRRWVARRSGARRGSLVAVMAFQLVVATYGGFFGAGMGILMLAALGVLGLEDIHEMNGVKNLAAVAVNVVASLVFMAKGQVRWPIALVMAVGALIGGRVGASGAKRIGEARVRGLVVAIGIAIGTLMLLRR